MHNHDPLPQQQSLSSLLPHTPNPKQERNPHRNNHPQNPSICPIVTFPPLHIQGSAETHRIHEINTKGVNQIGQQNTKHNNAPDLDVDAVGTILELLEKEDLYHKAEDVKAAEGHDEVLCSR
jgi:hypothetical protein